MRCVELPIGAGVGLKPQHVDEALELRGPDWWFEVHTENYFIDGGPRLAQLTAARERFALSLHGVGGSLGSAGPPDVEHLRAVKRLVERFEPAVVSEHAVWSRHAGHYFADLLPLPRTREALERLSAGVDRYQCAIGRPILLENPANYLPFVSEMDEPEFLVEVCKRTGCGLLLDVNNVYVSERNCSVDARGYVSALEPSLVQEIHIAGFDPDPELGERLLIDSHAAPVSGPVWALLAFTLEHVGPKPVLVERDGNLPAFCELVEERERAMQLLRGMTAESHGA